METSDRSALNDAMNRLWHHYLPQIEERVNTLHIAAIALADGALTAVQCEQASSAAHNLAGVLGTFGLAEGTILAREAEAFYCIGPPVDYSSVNGRLAEVVTQLRAMIASR